MTDQVAPPPPQAGAPVPPQLGDGQVSPPPAAPEKKSGAGKKVLSILGAIVIAIVVAGLKFGIATALFGDKDKAAEAKVGDCIANLPDVKEGEEKKASNVKVVECGATEAAFSVVGRLENKTQAEASTTKECDQYFKEGDAYSIYYSIPTGGKGYVLCLKPKA